MRSKSCIQIIIVLAFLIGVSSCYSTKEAYVGKKQNKASLATVKGVIKSTKADNLTLLNFVDTIPVAGYKKSHILPGTHTIEITHCQKVTTNLFIIYFFLGNYLVTFDAEARKTYILNAEIIPETNLVDVYVTDADSGERIASTVEYKYKFKEKE